MSGFTVTISAQALEKGTKALDWVTCRAMANLRALQRDSTPPSWHNERVQITGTEYDPDLGRTILRAWVVDEDDVAQYRVMIDPQDLAGLAVL